MDEHSPGVSLIPWHFEDNDKPVQGTGRKKRVKPYVCVNLCELKGLPPSGVLVWLLLSRQWAATKKEWVTIPKRIRQEAGMGRRTVARGFVVLERKGCIELRKGAGKSTCVRKAKVSDK
jgi:hypothetical protein